MGLDMALYIQSKDEDEEKDYEHRYWRKHPALHRYLFKTFAPEAKSDNLTSLYLTKHDIEKIIKDIKNDVYGENSPSGFFWGNSLLVGDEGYEDQKEDDLEAFESAHNLIEKEECKVYYEAWY